MHLRRNLVIVSISVGLFCAGRTRESKYLVANVYCSIVLASVYSVLSPGSQKLLHADRRPGRHDGSAQCPAGSCEVSSNLILSS